MPTVSDDALHVLLVQSFVKLDSKPTSSMCALQALQVCSMAHVCPFSPYFY